MISLRPYQQEGLTAIWNYFQDGGKGNPCIAWPTGTGKSILPAIFISEVMKIYPTQKFLLVTHVSELLKQNAEVLTSVWPNCPLGFYSAGLKQKNAYQSIVFAGIQSAIKNPSIFGHRDLIFIDEAHLISTDDASMYLTFLATMKLINPHVKIIGMTATPFRMGQGMITDGGLFTEIVHDLCSMENFNKLIAEGYLAPLVPLRTHISLDVSNVGFTKGEYIQSQLQHAVDVAEVTFESVKELVAAGKDRKAWLIFSSGIEHGEHISNMLEQFGIDGACVHSKNTSEFNDKAIRAFKNGELRYIVNYGKLTTGFNYPAIDLIGMLRPTLSVPLWVQMLGRGTRPAEGKLNCLVLDFAKNTPRLGCINDPIIPKKKGSGNGEIPVKLCNACGVYHHIKAKICMSCGAEFSFEIKITKNAGHHELIKSDLPIVETFDVDRVIYQKIAKEGKIPYIRSTYYCGLRAFTENIFPEHPKSLTRHKFHEWWKQRHRSLPPSTVDDVLNLNAELRKPARIRIWLNKSPYPEILGSEY